MNAEFIPVNIAILTVSDSRTFDNDTSGKVLEDRARADGHHIVDRQIVPDDVYQIRAIVSQWIAHPEINVIVTTGGTGLTGRDGTPDAVKVLLKASVNCFVTFLIRSSKPRPCNHGPLPEWRMPPLFSVCPVPPVPVAPDGMKSSTNNWINDTNPAILSS